MGVVQNTVYLLVLDLNRLHPKRDEKHPLDADEVQPINIRFQLKYQPVAQDKL